MKKEVFIKAGVAAFGDSWKNSVQKALGLGSIQRINQWVKGTREIPDLSAELKVLLDVRKAQIEEAQESLEIDFAEKALDIDAKLVAVSDNGDLLGERFDTLEAAQKWAEDVFDEEDLYLIKYHEMTESEWLALQVIGEKAGLFEREEVLNLIRDVENYHNDKSEQDVYADLAPLIYETSAAHDYSDEYFDFYMHAVFQYVTERARERRLEYSRKSGGFGLSIPDEDDYFESPKLVSYKTFMLNKIAVHINYVAENL